MAAVYKDQSRPVDVRVDDLFARMTVAERMAQLCSVIVPFGKPPVTQAAGGMAPAPALREATAHERRKTMRSAIRGLTAVLTAGLVCVSVQGQTAPAALYVAPVVPLDSLAAGFSRTSRRVQIETPAELPESAAVGFYRKGSPEIRVPVVCNPSPIRTIVSVLTAAAERHNQKAAPDAPVVQVSVEKIELTFADVPAKRGRELQASVSCTVTRREEAGGAGPRTWAITADERRTVVRPRRHVAGVISGALASVAMQIAAVVGEQGAGTVR